MYVKEVMLLPLFLEESGGDWLQSWKSVQSTFESGKWTRSLKRVQEAYGPLDAMQTDDHKDVWEVWKSSVWPVRGALVHGNAVPDPTDDEARKVVMWAEQMMIQLTLRLVRAGKHPVHDLLKAALEESRALMSEGEASRE
jgi:hypothetical protein